MFEKLLDKLDLWVGKSFIVTSFLPALLFVVANIILARAVFPGFYNPVQSAITGSLSGFVDFLSFVVIACVVIAYVTDPLARQLTQALNGDYFPGFIRRRLLQEKTAEYDLSYGAYLDAKKRESDVGDVAKAFYEEPDRPGTPKGRLIDAKIAGLSLERNLAPELIEEAERILEPLWLLRQRGEGIEAEALRKALDAVAGALENNCSDSARVLSQQTLATALAVTYDDAAYARAVEIADRNRRAAAQSNALQALYERAIVLVTYADLEAQYRPSNIREDNERRWPNMPRSSANYFTPIKPTTFGNIFVAGAAYVERTFGFDLDYMLPILQSVLAKDDALSKNFANVQQQLNFSIRLYLYVCLSIIIWLGLATAFAQETVAPLVVGTIELVIVPIGLSTIHASARAFVESLRTVSILKRFDVLRAIDMPLPGSPTEETETWKAVSDHLQWGAKPAVSYLHGDKK